MLLISIIWYVIIGSEKRQMQQVNAIWVKRVIISSIIWCCVLSMNNITTLWDWENNQQLGITLFNNYFQWSQVGGLLELISYIMVLILIRQEWGIEKIFSIWGIVMFLYVNDYISFFIVLECQSLVLYLLASRDSISAGLKYFIIGSLSSAIIILGIAIIYSKTGLTEIQIINNIQDGDVIWARRFIVIGILIKLGIPPFHLWNIDIMDNTKTDLTAWFGTISKISLLFILRLILPCPPLQHCPLVLGSNLGIFIIVCLIVGSFMGLIQNKIKRLLAYSGVVHMGFILLGLQGITSYVPGAILGYESWIFYIAQYFLSLIIVLLIVGRGFVYYINDFKVNNFTMIFLIINLLSLAGFPPLLGFIGKFSILQGMIGNGFLICLIAMIISVFSFFIYFNVISLIIIDKTHSILNLTDAWIISSGTLLPIVGVFTYFLLP